MAEKYKTNVLSPLVGALWVHPFHQRHPRSIKKHP